MKIHIVESGEGVLPEKIYNKVVADVRQAIQDIVANSKKEFIVNDTPWYSVNISKKGVSKAMNRVMNSADYMSKGIGGNLQKLGWWAGSKEKSIENQKIDGYIEIPFDGEMFSLAENDFLYMIKDLFESANKNIVNQSLRHSFNFLHSLYCKKSWIHPDFYNVKDSSKFKKEKQRSLKIGLEFETGNIASSFRALSKLENLFLEGHIDYGIFITSIDKKSTAARIWPTSNRNGSFEELDKRNYKLNLTVPLMEIGFEPDKYDKEVKYLAPDGSLYEPVKEEESIELAGDKLQKYNHNGNFLYKKVYCEE